jgi:hypothetical protein
VGRAVGQLGFIRAAAMPMKEEMSVDYRLVPHFEASRRRYAAARELLPERWRSDPRPEMQLLNDTWVSVIARAREHIDEITRSPSARRPPSFLEDR